MGLKYRKFKSQSATSRWRKGQPLLTNERTGIRAFEPSNETRLFKRRNPFCAYFSTAARLQSQSDEAKSGIGIARGVSAVRPGSAG
jgi:hypothetical protein